MYPWPMHRTIQVDYLGEMPNLIEKSAECIETFQNFCSAYNIK